MEYSSKKPLVSAPAGFEPVPIPKNPHEDVDSMRVIGPADTDAMRVNPSPNDPTLAAPPIQETKLLVKERRGIQIKFSPSEEAMFKALEEAGWYEAIMGPDDRGVRGMSREEAEAAGHIGPIGEKGEVSQCWNGDPRLNPKRGVGPSKEELLDIYEEIMEDDFKKAMNTSAPGLDPNKYVTEHKAKLDAIWQRIINRNKTGGAS